MEKYESESKIFYATSSDGCLAKAYKNEIFYVMTVKELSEESDFQFKRKTKNSFEILQSWSQSQKKLTQKRQGAKQGKITVLLK